MLLVSKDGQPEARSQTISALSHTDNQHTQEISISRLLAPISSQLQHLVCPGKVFREYGLPHSSGISPQGALTPNPCFSPNGSAWLWCSDWDWDHPASWVESARPHGLFLFCVHLVTLATENKERQSTTYYSLHPSIYPSIHREMWGAEGALAWKSGGQVPAWAMWATGWLLPTSRFLPGPVLDKTGA